MNSRRFQSQRNQRSFRPCLEQLETRDCPSCTIFQRGDTLFILGDRGNNHIVIADARAGGLTVTCEAGDPHVYPNVRKINLNTLAGDDDVSISLGRAAATIVEVAADLGAGNDQMTIRGFDPQPDPPSQAKVEYLIRAGTGDDHLSVEIPTDQPRLAGNLHFVADLGAGNDEFMMNVGDVVLSGGFMMSVEGGAGNDNFLMDLGNSTFNGSFMMHTDGGAGNDQFMMRLGDGEINGQFMMKVTGGAGNDILDSFIIPCVRPAGHSSFIFDGEAGNDHISVQAGLDEDDTGALAVQVRGGLGNDNITLAAYNIPDSVLLTALLDGGRGRDIAHLTRNVRLANCEEAFFL